MPEKIPPALVDELITERERISALVASRRLRPLLGLDLTLHQLKIISLICSGEADVASHIAAALGSSAPAVSVSIEKLVDAGYLKRCPLGSDRRSHRLEPTLSADAVYADFLGLRDASRDLLESLKSADLQALLQGTRALREAMQQAPRSPLSL